MKTPKIHRKNLILYASYFHENCDFFVTVDKGDNEFRATEKKFQGSETFWTKKGLAWTNKGVFDKNFGFCMPKILKISDFFHLFGISKI